MKTYIVAFILFVLFFMSCKKDTTITSNNKNTVSGKIVSNSIPVANATVSLNKQQNYSTQTDSNGSFSISNVPDGSYSLNINKINPDGTSQERTANITVTEDLTLQSLLLPRPIKILTPANITGTSMMVSWNSTDANDFREYKLYRHSSSGLDENTGTLIHVSTSISDTLFEDNGLSPITQYYYRVFVMNDFGKLGGSNIVSSKTSNINYVQNGSFEDTVGFPKWWRYGNTSTDSTALLTNITSKEGNYSLVMVAKPFSEYGVTGVRSRLKSGFAKVAEGDYKISFWVKVQGIPDYVSSYNWNSFAGSENYIAGISNDNTFPIGVKRGSIVENEWVYVESQVKILDMYYKNYGFYFEIASYCNKVWFDDIKLEKVE
jgi:hypothetical protein